MKQNSCNDRLLKAKEIASNPALYKICEGCESIVGIAADTCPNCHGYRFDTEINRVINQAIFLGTRKQSSVTVEDMA